MRVSSNHGVPTDHCQQSTTHCNEVFFALNGLNNKERKYSLSYHQHDEFSVSVNQVINVGRDEPLSISHFTPPLKKKRMPIMKNRRKYAAAVKVIGRS